MLGLKINRVLIIIIIIIIVIVNSYNIYCKRNSNV